MRSRLIAVLTVAAAACLVTAGLAGGTGSTLPSGNLLQNPGAEASPGSADGQGPPAAIPGWSTSVQQADSPVRAGFMVVQYGTSGFPDKIAGAKINGGANFFGGGDATGLSSASQTVDVSQAAAEIDGGHVAAQLAADLGGFSSQDDYGVVTASFLDTGGSQLGQVTIGPVTEAQRGAATELLPRSATGLVPKGTRSIRVTMTAKRFAGSWDDGYFDNIDLELLKAVAPHPVLSLGCSAKRVLTARVSPATGLKSVTFTVGGLRKTVTRAPFSARFALGKLRRHLLVKASAAATLAGSPIVLKKRAPC